MTTVVLLRHGVTDWNDGGRFQGHADVSLNDAGREQAAAAASMLAESGITRVYCSDLLRAAETAQIVAANLGLEVRTDARLREVDVGSWAGLSMAEAGELEPDFWPALREGRDFRRSATGETATESGLRVAAMLLIGLDYSHARRFGGMVNCHWAVLQPGDEHWRLLSYNVG